MLDGPLLIGVLVLSVLFIIFATAKLKLHPFLALMFASFLAGFMSLMPFELIVESINGGFGSLMGGIGIVIVAGTIIGTILEKSGAALKMAEVIIRRIGEKRPQLAMSLVGAIVSIPVFCDSGYVILSSLKKAMARRANVALASMAVALSTGLFATHTLVPPTPGPIAAAGNLGAEGYLGTIILVGIIVSIPTIAVGYLWATRVAVNIKIEGEEENLSYDDVLKEFGDLPPAWKAFAPILVPIILIGLSSLLSILQYEGFGSSFATFLGAPMVALFVGVLFSFLLLPRFNEETLNGWVGEGLKVAAPILLITAAGGAFGRVLTNTPLSDFIEGFVTGSGFTGAFVLIVPFLISAALKTAQGSSTAALVVTSALIAPLLPSLGIETPLQLALTVMAIGAGAMTVSHVNDSYFWVVAQFSGMKVTDAYKAQTMATLLQGITAFSVTFLLYLLLA
ncbi:GntP family permease [Jeotgalibacillus proteolyticus]|uniref:Gluconate transporter n=1 Tax=Jeotgalibacillus proteolyticus TaxID=2082395 RepID=A0A2S5GD47_9BACL|nr:GntP family permease [Jeotgalibacillus proteolyticus]PPA70909.1 gluconate transporter [Jeotgalibacillus proteolyticus]